LDLELDTDLVALRDAAAAFARAELMPHAERWDAEKIFPIDTLRAAAALGFAGIYVGEQSGGSGLSRLAAAILFEELAAGCPSTAAYLSIHNMVAWMIDAHAEPAQRARFLPSLMTMERLASYCLTEPGAGSDAAALRTTARRDGDAYVLDGAKAFISGAGAADLYLVMCRTGAAGARGISSIIVEAGTPGLSFGQQERKLGWNSQPTATVHLDGCRVPIMNRIGAEGEGFKIAMRGLDGGRINIAACSLGAARAALDRALGYVKERRQFGRPIAEFQNTQFTLADMATELEAARLMVWRAAVKLDRKAPDATAAAAMAKRFATDVGFAVIDKALQLHGGYGYIRDYGIERLLRDARVHRILEGTNEIMRLIVARELLKG
jgi:alkylation response protein AidB-like acyl-CoA dehydrogenase